MVIGILAAISIVAYNNVQQKARDSQRAQDIATITKALEMYYVDKGEYPAGSGAGAPLNGAWSTTNDNSWQNLATALSPYISTLPVDPTNDGTGYNSGTYGYSYFSNGEAGAGGIHYCGASAPRKMYILAYRLESGSQKQETVGNCSTRFLTNSNSYYRAVK